MLEKNEKARENFHSHSAIRLITLAGALFIALITTPAISGKPMSYEITKFRLAGGHIQFSNPTLADVNGDGKPEILVGTTACSGNPCNQNQPTRVEVVSGNGVTLWSRNPGGPINSSPTVADIDGDGDVEVIVSIGGAVDDMNQNGGVVAYSHTGTQLWRFTTVDHFPYDGYADGVYSTPAVCDVDSDGDMEIAFGGWDQRLYMLDHNGQMVWQNSPNGWPTPGYLNGDSSWSSPACADFNNDGNLEIVIGADISRGGVLPDGTQPDDGGYVYVFDRFGQTPLARRYMPEAIYSSPAVADLDNDGQLEIVVGTAWHWWNQNGRTEQPYVYVFQSNQLFSGLHYSDPNKLPHEPGWPRATTYPGFSSPAVADLDNDGDLEVIIGTGHPDLGGDPIPGAGKMHAWHHNGQPVSGWPIHPRNAANEDAPLWSSPTVADVDGDGYQEVLFSYIWDLQIYSHNGVLQERLPTTWTLWGSPAVGDADGDGILEIWVGGANQWSNDKGYLWRFRNGTTDSGEHDWPMFRGNQTHTGKYGEGGPAIEVEGGTYHVFHDRHTSLSHRVFVDIDNPSSMPVSYQVTNLPSGMSVSPASGVLQPFESRRLIVTISGAGRPPGTHELQATLNATYEGQLVPGSPAPISATLYVVDDVYQGFAPSVIR